MLKRAEDILDVEYPVVRTTQENFLRQRDRLPVTYAYCGTRAFMGRPILTEQDIEYRRREVMSQPLI